MTPQKQRVYERFCKDVAEHGMTVVLDHGLHRHLRFRKPGTIIYGFEIVTWPGYLAIVGDMGDYVFARTSDMLTFFESPEGYVNPAYWAEKVQGNEHDPGRRYTHESLEAKLIDWVRMECNKFGRFDDIYQSLLIEAVKREFLHTYIPDEQEAFAVVEDTGLVGREELIDWDLREWDEAFLWLLHAIVYGIARYREYTARRIGGASQAA